MTAITLRPATSADKKFCFRLHKAAMGDYITGIWGWDERFQRDFHTRAFDPRRWQLAVQKRPRSPKRDGSQAGRHCLESTHERR